MTLYDYLIRSAHAALDIQHNNGSMPPGHNGPYHEIETPVRNTSHWILTFLKAYTIAGDLKFKDAAERATHYLISNEVRPCGATFLCLKDSASNPGNGLIGQAWAVEALVCAAETLQMQECYDIAEKVFLLHPWDHKNNLWRKVHVDGRTLLHDYTFNHQLWFAAAASMLKNTPEAQEHSKAFTEHLKTHMRLYSNGIIKHLNPLFIGRMVDIPKAPLKILYFYGIKRHYFYRKAVGYHGFNLYALGILSNSFPSLRLWRSYVLKKLFSPVQSNEFIRELAQSNYAYPYNPAGIEIAYALEKFYPEQDERIKEWLNRQFSITWDEQNSMMWKSAADPLTNAARIYEATRLKNYENIQY